MLITDVMVIEHRLLGNQADYIEQYLPDAVEVSELHGILKIFVAAFESHAHLEEELFFCELEKYLGAEGVIMSLRENMGHEEMLTTMQNVFASEDLEQTCAKLTIILNHVRKHFICEESELFPLAEKKMKFDHLATLGNQRLLHRNNGI